MLGINNNAQLGPLPRYNNLHIFFQNVINALYNDENQDNSFEIYDLTTEEIININGSNDLKKLNPVSEKTGVYIFINKRNNPVYIGVAGQGKKTKHSLKERLQIQLNAHKTNGTLAKNIMDIKNIEYDERRCKKELIITFAPKLIVISLGPLNRNNNRKAQALEKVLTVIFDPVYNR